MTLPGIAHWRVLSLGRRRQMTITYEVEFGSAERGRAVPSWTTGRTSGSVARAARTLSILGEMR